VASRKETAREEGPIPLEGIGLEEFVAYAVEHGLVKKKPSIEDLFCPGCNQLKAVK
jgi:hypothetical protein